MTHCNRHGECKSSGRVYQTTTEYNTAEADAPTLAKELMISEKLVTASYQDQLNRAMDEGHEAPVSQRTANDTREK